MLPALDCVAQPVGNDHTGTYRRVNCVNLNVRSRFKLEPSVVVNPKLRTVVNLVAIGLQKFSEVCLVQSKETTT